jgi:hypothetical protein
MMSPYRILLVCPENQKVLGGEIRTELEENLFGEEQQVTVDWVKSEVGARDFLADPKSQYHLIITALHIPPGPKTPLNPAVRSTCKSPA